MTARGRRRGATDPSVNATVAIPLHTRGTPVCTSMANANIENSSRPTPTGFVGRAARP